MPLTRDEFLDEFIKAAGLPKSARTPDGIKDGSFERVAVECPDLLFLGDFHYHHGHPCRGWVLVSRPRDTRQLAGGAVYTVTSGPVEPRRNRTSL